MSPAKKAKSPPADKFNVEAFLESAGVARNLVEFEAKDTIFSQGDAGKDVMYIQKGTIKLSVVSKTGRVPALPDHAALIEPLVQLYLGTIYGRSQFGP